MANEITGRETICGLAKAGVWHTPVACEAGDGVLILADNIKVGMELELDESAGQEWVTEADAGVENVAGNIEAYMRYEGFDVWLALIMGSAGVPVQQEATAAYAGTYNLTSKVDGLFGTLAQKKLVDKIWEYPSVKLHGFKLSAEMNKPVKISFEAICDTLKRDSTTNTAVTMALVTALKQNRVIMNKDTVFRMNNQEDVALADSHKLYPASFELTFSRPMESDYVAGQDGLEEPADNGFPACTLALKFPRYNTANDAYFDDWQNTVSKKMDITFTGKTIEGAHKYKLRILLSNLKIDSPEAPVSGPGKIPYSMNLKGIGASTAPAGMTALTAPMRIEVVNKRTTNPLA
ncbi:MAG: hypothetical protein VR65_20015 [Desulfobulbaceae bacterium BRH_c16a]|nr:MAG: hypothetical protein VR65_20015 [Desulfobulbaceae bacterium BRH_c16a]